jgi:hypothetical protein
MAKFLIFAAVSVAVVAAVLAALGFRGRPVSAGIDLGTTYSAAAFVVAGEPSLTAPTSSVIAIIEGVFVVGRSARAHAGDHPWASVIDSKRVIGRNALDEFAVAEAARHGGRLVMHPQVKRNRFGKAVPSSKWSVCDGCQHDLAFVLRDPSSTSSFAALGTHVCVEPGSFVTGAQILGFMQSAAPSTWTPSISVLAAAVKPDDSLLLLTPQAAGCLIVQSLLSAGRSLDVYPSSVVAAVPADFSVLQREATLEAFARAGVKVSRLLYEPAAAAIAYGLHRNDSIRHVLVFDMGGGTTDVSILYLQDGAFTLIGSAGDGHLGGEVGAYCLPETPNLMAYRILRCACDS